MKQRGRKSAATLTLLPSVLERCKRPEPPADLNREETDVFLRVINTQEADWFSPANIDLLTQYSRHIVQAGRIAGWVDEMLSAVDPETGRPTFEIKDYEQLLRMQRAETAAIIWLATKMRLTPQSTINHRGNKVQSAARKPWEGYD